MLCEKEKPKLLKIKKYSAGPPHKNEKNSNVIIYSRQSSNWSERLKELSSETLNSKNLETAKTMVRLIIAQNKLSLINILYP